MHDSIRRHFASFLKSVQESSLPDDRKEFFAASIDRLPPMYATYRDTNDSRHGDEITRVVQTMLKALEGCPEGREIRRISDRPACPSRRVRRADPAFEAVAGAA